MDPRAHTLGSGEKKISYCCQDSNTKPFSPQDVTMTTMLPWLHTHTHTTYNTSHTLQWLEYIKLVMLILTCQAHIQFIPHTWTYCSNYCYDMFIWMLKMHKSDQTKITHSLIRQYLMACKVALVLVLTDVRKKIYKFPAKKVLKILSGNSQKPSLILMCLVTLYNRNMKWLYSELCSH
jgi:hypothetical protein